eukprot:423957-Pyramimonas_sp.AAC.1
MNNTTKKKQAGEGFLLTPPHGPMPHNRRLCVSDGGTMWYVGRTHCCASDVHTHCPGYAVAQQCRKWAT